MKISPAGSGQRERWKGAAPPARLGGQHSGSRRCGTRRCGPLPTSRGGTAARRTSPPPRRGTRRAAKCRGGRNSRAPRPRASSLRRGEGGGRRRERARAGAFRRTCQRGGRTGVGRRLLTRPSGRGRRRGAAHPSKPPGPCAASAADLDRALAADLAAALPPPPVDSSLKANVRASSMSSCGVVFSRRRARSPPSTPRPARFLSERGEAWGGAAWSRQRRVTAQKAAASAAELNVNHFGLSRFARLTRSRAPSTWLQLSTSHSGTFRSP
mmetsp:Transcript_20688/g.62137  ORF Transcript_20688/g.62137 Transcript_20688/m.62137 type:complete len:269 (+) Transcript_20688:627-1433(+)